MKDFMELTIEAHCLTCVTPYQAEELTPSREANYFEAKKLVQTSNYFERRNILVSDDDFVYPPLESFKKSFEKWLTLQEHDVKAVNSLYLRQKEVQMKQCELMDEIYDLENILAAPSLQIHVDKLLARKEEEYRQLSRLRHDLSEAVDRTKASKYSARQMA